MHHALRSSLALAAIAAITPLTGCQTHDRRIYTTHRDINLHTPDPWEPSTTKAAEDATAGLGIPPGPVPSSDATAPGPMAAPGPMVPPANQ